MGKEKLERIPDEQIEPISGGKKDSSEDRSGVKGPRFEKFKEEFNDMKKIPGSVKFSSENNREQHW